LISNGVCAISPCVNLLRENARQTPIITAAIEVAEFALDQAGKSNVTPVRESYAIWDDAEQRLILKGITNGR